MCRIVACVGFSLALLTLSQWAAPAEPNSGWQQTSTLAAPEAIQAAAADAQFVYAIASAQIAKYDRQTGERLAVSTGDAKHLNSGFFWNGLLYCAHSNYPAVPEQSEIKFLDPHTMRLTTFKDFRNYGGSLTWVVRRDDAWWCNFARYGAKNGETFLVKFDADWHEQGRWLYPPEVIRRLGRHSISGGIWLGDAFLMTGHDDPILFRLRLPEVGQVLELVESQTIPFTGQGIASDPATGGLVGIDRAKRQVVFAAPSNKFVDNAPPDLLDHSAEVRLTHDGHFKQRPIWSPDGSRLLFTRHARDKIWLYTVNQTGDDERRLTQRSEPEYDGAWSPDGLAVAFTSISFSGTQGDLDVVRCQSDGSNVTPLMKTIGKLSHEEWPAWSADGRRLAVTSTQPGNQEVFVLQSDGGKPQQVTHHAGIDAHPAWSPDGHQIAFSTDRWGGLEIAVMNADGSEVRRLTSSRGLDDYPVWSPDGQLLVFVSNRDGNFEIYLMRSDGSEQANLSRSPELDTFPTWTPDGRGVTYVSERSGSCDIYTQRLGR